MVYQRIFEGLLFISEGLVFYYYANSLFTVKIKKFFSMMETIIAYLFLFFVYLYGNGAVNTFVMLIINFLLFRFLFKCNVKNAIFHSSVLVFLMLTTELLSVALTTMLFNVDFSVYATDTTLYILNVVISKMIYYIFCFGLSRLFNRSKGKFGVDSRFWILMIVPMVSLVILTVLFNTAINVQIPEHYKLAFSISSFLLVISNIIVFFVYERSIKDAAELIELKTADQKAKIDKTYFEILEMNNENLKIFTHDIKNHLLHIGNLAQNEEVDKYITNLCGTVMNYGSNGISKNKTLDILINKYILLCESKRIKIYFDAKTANLSFIDPPDLTALLNNLLDNAVESAEKTQEKMITVKFFSKNNTMEVISITNSCNVPPKTKNVFFVTTKEDKHMHGIGTRSVKRVIDKYNGSFDWSYNNVEQTFEICIIF